MRTELIEHFKDPSVMNCNIDFIVINEKGEFEQSVGVGEICAVFFSVFMTIGEREKVPFVRHDHFVEEWQAVGRIYCSYTELPIGMALLIQINDLYCIMRRDLLYT